MQIHSSLQQHRSERFYFAFGSNLYLGQMAKRCPESRYIGTAKLHDYRFQVNQRGYANVLPSPGDCVEGLVYLLNGTDEARLDRSEGVPTAYQKRNLTIEVFTAAIDYAGRAVPELAQRLEGSGNTKDDTHHQAWADKRIDPKGYDGSRRLGDYFLKGETTEALVYLSDEFVQDSEPRDEYIDRMNAGIIDARKLGMSDMYIGACLRHYIPDRELPNQEFMLAQQRILDSRSHRSRQSGPA